MLPQWTESVKIEDGARDPLGLDRVYDRFGEWLLPGITTITPRARYFSYYLWSMQAARQHDHVNRHPQYIEAMRRREAAYVLANMADRSDGGNEVVGLIGWRKGRRVWLAGEERGTFSTDFQPVRNPLGGFDQAYGGSLLKLGLWQRTEATGHIDQPTETGEALAQAYGRSISKTKYYRKLQQEQVLSLSDLQELASAGGLSHLNPDGEEAQLLTNLFFNRPPFDSASGQARRETLLLCLHIMSVAADGRPVESYVADDLWVEQAGYFHALRCEGGRVRKCIIPEQLVRANDAHAILQSHRYLALALEHLLACVIEIAEHAGEISINDLIEGLNWREIQRTFMRDSQARTPIELAGWVEGLRGQAVRQPQDGVVLFPLSHSGSEEAVVNAFDDPSVDVRLGNAMRLIVSVHLRAKMMQTHVSATWIEAAQIASNSLWQADISDQIELACAKRWSIRMYATDLLSKFVIRQHDEVRRIKGTLARGWIEQGQEGRIRKVQDFVPRYRGTRLNSAESILIDLGLLERAGQELRLAKRGKRFLERELAEQRRNAESH